MVSVCMITYNHEPYIARAIEGVLEQESPFSYELVIGDDHWTDRPREICLKYEMMHPGVVRVLGSDVNLGITGNFARTLVACPGKYIALCEGDDFWTDRSKLHKQVKFLEEHPEYAMTSGRVQRIFQDKVSPARSGTMRSLLI